MYKNIKRLLSLTLLLLINCMQLACTQPGGVDDNSKVLARVNAEPITENQLAANVQTLFGKTYKLDQLKDTERRKILESMVISRLIKQQAEKNLDDAQKLLYEQKARAYKEKIIVNDYLKKNITPAPISSEMVVAYYNKHPEKFGAVEDVNYELLTTKSKLNEVVRDQLLFIYGTLDKTAELQSIQKRIAEKGIQLNYQKGNLRSGLLNGEIENVLISLRQGETSALFMQQGRPYIIKLLERKQYSAKPLSVVSADIRKQLVPVALKKAIKQQTDKLKESAKIEYLNQ